MSVATAHILDAPPSYDTKLYPALDLAAYSLGESNSDVGLDKLTDVLKEHEKKNPGDFKNRIIEALKKVDAEATLKDLTNNVHQINGSFEKISTALGILDEKNYRKKKDDGSTDGDVIEKFRPTWDKISSDFNDLIWTSRKVATEAAGHAQAFREVYVPLLKNNAPDGPSLDDKKLELKAYIEDLDKSKIAAEAMSDGFTKLPPRIREVQTRVNIALKAVGENFDAKISNLQKDIRQLNEKIAKYTGLAQTAMWVGVGGAAVCGAGVLLSLTGFLAPLAVFAVWGGAIVGMAGAIVDIVAASIAIAAENERDDKIAELNQLTKDLATFKEIQGKVELALKDCSGLCDRINAIGTVWAVIRTESQLIYDSMKKAEKARTKWTFEGFLGEGIVGNPYEKLEEVLILYANNVTAVDPNHK